MVDLKNLDYNKISDYENKQHGVRILTALDKLIGVVKEPNELEEILMNDGMDESIISIYSSICLLLGETRELINGSIDVDELSFQYMTRIKKLIESQMTTLSCSLFGGLADIGLGVHAVYKTTGYYKKFLDSLNKLIVKTTLEEIQHLKENIKNLEILSYDTVFGLAGVTAYLLLFKEDKEVDKAIKEALTYFILMTQDQEVFGYPVPSYYISFDNLYSEEEQNIYPKGNFNLGLSHGITGPLTVMSLALNEGIEVEGQRDAIKRILEDLKVFKYIDDNGGIFWPGRVKFEDYITKKCNLDKRRASWCYGTPGIARAMYFAGKSIQDYESIELAKKAFDGLCNMNQEDWLLDSPTICHGYSGLLAVIQSMYKGTGDLTYQKCAMRITDIVLGFYEENSKYGFIDINYIKGSDEKVQLEEKEGISFLNGSIGVVLALLSSTKQVDTNWMRHMMLD